MNAILIDSQPRDWLALPCHAANRPTEQSHQGAGHQGVTKEQVTKEQVHQEIITFPRHIVSGLQSRLVSLSTCSLFQKGTSMSTLTTELERGATQLCVHEPHTAEMRSYGASLT